MARSPRVRWLSALALLAPCLLVGTVAFQWLALEREVSARRGVDGAQSAVRAVRRSLDSYLQAVGGDTVRALLSRSPDRGPFAAPEGLPSVVHSAALFDATGQVLEPQDAAFCDRAAAAYRTAADTAWQQDVSAIQLASKNGGPAAARAAEALASRTTDSALRASALLLAARLSLAAGQPAAAEASAARLIDCCAAARDEFGVAFALYAVWQRVTAAFGAVDRDQRLSLVARDLRDLIERGYLASAGDAAEIRALASRVPTRSDLAALVPVIDRARAGVERRAAEARKAGEWLARTQSVDSPNATVRVGVLAGDPTPTVIASAPAGDRRIVVMMLDVDALSAWVEQLDVAHASFDIRLRAGDTAATAPDLLDVPLTSDAAGLVLSARAGPGDPMADRRREGLFLAAIGAALALTLAVAFLAMRDVSRELRLARLQSAFIAGVTHELKTPLTSIRLLAETLRDGRAKPGQSADLLETVVHEAERVGRMVDNVLSSSRIDSGTRVYTRKLATVQDVVDQAMARLDYVLQSEGFRITREFDPKPLRALVDVEALEQGVLNLLSNAMKYSAANKEITVRVVHGEHEVKIAVVDRGMGIAPHDQAHVFDRFYRAPNVRADTTGAGLGLSLVKHFAEAHSGHVAVSSELGRGSVFCIWIPLAED